MQRSIMCPSGSFLCRLRRSGIPDGVTELHKLTSLRFVHARAATFLLCSSPTLWFFFCGGRWVVRSKLSYLQSRSAKQEVLCPLGGVHQWCNTAVSGGERVSAAAFLCTAAVMLSDFNLTSDFHNSPFFFFFFLRLSLIIPRF